METNKQDVRNFRVKTRKNTDSRTRIGNFNEAVLFGPIFICSCCSRKLFENGVTKITPKFKKACDEKNPKFYSSCIEKDILVPITFNGKSDRTGHYICHTCRTSMRRGKMPSMAVQNRLQLKEIDECCNLTELENNLIAQIINFQYIICLPNSRWAATRAAQKGQQWQHRCQEISLKSHNWQEMFVHWNGKMAKSKNVTQEMIIMPLGRN